VGGDRSNDLRSRVCDEPFTLPHLIDRGKAATRLGKNAEARYHLRCALRLDPDDTEVLLWLGYLAGGGRPSLEYLVRVLDADPSNPRARSAIRWARSRAGPDHVVAPEPEKRRQGGLRYAQVVLLICCVLSIGLSVGIAAAAMALDTPEPQPTRALIIAASHLTPDPTAAKMPAPTVAVATQSTEAEQPTPTLVVTSLDRNPLSGSWASSQTEVRAAAQSVLLSTATRRRRDLGRHTSRPIIPPVSEADLSADHQTTSTAAPTLTPSASIRISATPFPTARIGDSFRWIDVDLSQQVLIAYEGETAVRSVAVSTGLPRTPTVTGRFKVYVKYRAADMSGPGYYLTKVPYIMYFYRGYGIHGTYWHSNFGQPMSHGCVNLPTPEAEWLFQWASVGTPVNIHY
jgi:lipoprotein-anchoring transpeptidase ErfK/SrfK